MIGIVRNREIKTNRDGTQDVLMLQVELSGPDDLQSVELLQNGGTFYSPPDGTKVQILQNGPGWKVAVAVNDQRNFPSDLKIGERTIYSKNQEIKLKDDGTIALNGEGFGGLVKWPELEKQLDAANKYMKGISDAITSAATATQDGGATFKTNITTSLKSLKLPDYAEVENDAILHGRP